MTGQINWNEDVMSHWSWCRIRGQCGNSTMKSVPRETMEEESWRAWRADRDKGFLSASGSLSGLCAKPINTDHLQSGDVTLVWGAVDFGQFNTWDNCARSSAESRSAEECKARSFSSLLSAARARTGLSLTVHESALSNGSLISLWRRSRNIYCHAPVTAETNNNAAS